MEQQPLGRLRGEPPLDGVRRQREKPCRQGEDVAAAIAQAGIRSRRRRPARRGRRETCCRRRDRGAAVGCRDHAASVWTGACAYRDDLVRVERAPELRLFGRKLVELVEEQRTGARLEEQPRTVGGRAGEPPFL
jgi:hypothetical protein